MNDQAMLKIECLFGHAELDSRYRLVGDKLIAEGRSRRYRDGQLVETTPWAATGAVLSFGDEPRGPLSWWQRRKNRRELLRLAKETGLNIAKDTQ